MAMNDSLPVAGYRPQSDERIAAVNEHKQAEERLLRTIDSLLLRGLVDVRWASVARTHFEQGFMALNRGVFQPTRIALPEDAPALAPR
jgi:hypothetical protein